VSQGTSQRFLRRFHGRQKCEVDTEKDCAWEVIYESLEMIGCLDQLKGIRDVKDRLAE
jgi:hypothetical protein